MIEIDNQVISFPNISGILDTAVKDISKRVVGLTMENLPKQDMREEDLCSLAVTTHGDYCLTIILYANSRILRAITQSMKHGVAASDEDIPIYTTEYFNILCGHIISAMNVIHHSKARFGIPKLVRGVYQSGTRGPGPECRQEYFYNCAYGTIKMETLFKCS